jgi:hypothetical protein
LLLSFVPSTLLPLLTQRRLSSSSGAHRRSTHSTPLSLRLLFPLLPPFSSDAIEEVQPGSYGTRGASNKRRTGP